MVHIQTSDVLRVKFKRIVFKIFFKVIQKLFTKRGTYRFTMRLQSQHQPRICCAQMN